uniref:Uncharacterized protein n=1 Tax=Setaria viridis TaxID=4556 RepID=A0A4U6UJV7_SETVI|nr:hypothetical protein SEVIR_5G300350v2 [Setaria viridis]TKW16449.1 hypothetical protein SEVIR_5G300350v2 [Setaria viridis]
MASIEEKIDLLIQEVKKLQLEQVKLITKVDAINTWSIPAEKTASDLRNSIKTLTSRMAAFEAATSAPPPQAPSREEEERAIGHHYEKSYQGADLGSSKPDPTLIKEAAPLFSCRARRRRPFSSLQPSWFVTARSIKIMMVLQKLFIICSRACGGGSPARRSRRCTRTRAARPRRRRHPGTPARGPSSRRRPPPRPPWPPAAPSSARGTATGCSARGRAR